MIDHFIKDIQGAKPDKYGANSKCWLFGSYALIAGRFNPEELKRVKTIGQQLYQENVAIVPIVEYKTVSEADEFGYCRTFVLQRRAQGEELYTKKATEADYKNRLKDLASRPIAFYDKFVQDWLKISANGLRIDPSKSANFFYTPEKIHFIDLNLGKTTDKEEAFHEAAVVLMGGGAFYKFDQNRQEQICVLQNLTNAFIKAGANPDKLSEITTKQYPDIAPISFTNTKPGSLINAKIDNNQQR